MSKRSPGLLLQDIHDSIVKINRYVAGYDWNQFSSNEMAVDAVVRNLEIIGEAAVRLPLEFRQKNNHIEWVKIVGLRNRVIHEYFGVDLEIIWQIVQSDLPEFKKELEQLPEFKT